MSFCKSKRITPFVEGRGHSAVSFLLAAVAAMVVMVMPVLAHDVPEPEGYRMDNYMSPVPATVKGGTTIHAGALHRKLASGVNVVLIDVLPLRRKPPDFPPDRFWRTAPRYNIPNSVWLPNVGYGNIAPEFETYFKENLARLAQTGSAGKEDKPPEMVFYCLRDCWMSWNAAKRAVELGYQNVFWFPGGTDEWDIMGYSLERSKPVKMPDFATSKSSVKPPNKGKS